MLQVCYISSVSVEVILASSSLQERKRDIRILLALSSMATTPKRMLLQVNLGTSRGPFSPKIKVTQVVCALIPPFHSLDFFSFFSYPTKLFLFSLLDLNERLSLVDIFLFAHS